MRRRSVILWSIAVLLGIPLALLAIGTWYLHSGRIERRIEVFFHHRLPGELRVGRFQWPGGNVVILHDVTLGEPGQEPMATVQELVLTFSDKHIRVETLQIIGAHLRLDLKSWELLNHMIDAENAIKPTGPPHRMKISATGDVAIEGGARISDINIDDTSWTEGPKTSIHARAVYGGEPVDLDIQLHPQGTTQVMDITALRAKGPLAPMLLGMVNLNLIGETPQVIAPYLPEVIDATGTSVTHDLEADSWTGNINAHWQEAGRPQGQLLARLNADANAVKLSSLSLSDPKRLIGEGSYVADLKNERLSIDFSRWRPGTMMPVPESVPQDALLEIMPALHCELWWHDKDEHFIATLSSLDQDQSQMTLRWAEGEPITIEASALPLSLSQNFLPRQIILNGGQASRVLIRIGKDGMETCRIEASQARGSAFGWSAGMINGSCLITPTPDGSTAVSMQLLRNAGEGGSPLVDLGRISFTISPTTAKVAVHLSRVEDLLYRLHGPQGLPDLHGALDLELHLDYAPDTVKIHVDSLHIESLAKPDLLQDIEFSIRGGEVDWHDQKLFARFVGQLLQGSIQLPGKWVNIAQRTPSFSVDLVYSPPRVPAPGMIQINEILVGVADKRGDIQLDQYSTGLAGNLTATGSGVLKGVVFHADLGWVNSMLKLGALSMAGDGSVTFNAALQHAQVTRLDGTFLPDNADLRIGSDFQATGITGRVDFTMARNPPEGSH
jgi:hypothetical protein